MIKYLFESVFLICYQKSKKSTTCVSPSLGGCLLFIQGEKSIISERNERNDSSADEHFQVSDGNKRINTLLFPNETSEMIHRKQSSYTLNFNAKTRTNKGPGFKDLFIQ
jgi:hypothetical protein